MQVELQLQGRMPFLEGERGAPKEPEIALEEILAHDFVDALVLHLLTGGEEHAQQVFLPLVVRRQQGLVRHVLPLALGEALERVIGVGLVDPAELVEHAGAFDLERWDRAEQVPLAFHMIFQLAAAADDEALFGHVEPVERAARQLELLKDGDLIAGHMAVTDQERRTGKRRKTTADKPRRLVLYAFRLSRPREGFVVSAAIVHEGAPSGLLGGNWRWE